MNYILLSVLALLRIVCVEETLLHSVSPFTSPVYWIDAVGCFPSMYIIFQTLGNAEYRTQVMVEPHPLPRPVIANGPMSKAYVPRLVRKQVSPVPVIPPRQAPKCINRHLLPSFEAPGPKSVHNPFPLPTCKLDARPVQFVCPWTPLALSVLLFVVTWVFARMTALTLHDTAPPAAVRPRVSATIPVTNDPRFHAPGFTPAPRRKVDAHKARPTSVIPDSWPIMVPSTSRSPLVAPSSPLSRSIEVAQVPTPPVLNSCRPAPRNIGLSGSKWAPQAPPAEPIASSSNFSSPATSSTTPASSPQATLDLSTEATGCPFSPPLPPSALSTSVLADGLTTWAPMFVPEPVILAPVPRHPFICGFSGVNADICSPTASIATPSTPSTPCKCLKVETSRSSTTAAVPTFVPQQAEPRGSPRNIKATAPSTSAVTSFIGPSSPASPTTPIIDTTSSNMKVIATIAPPSPLLNCEKRDIGLRGSIHAPPPPPTSLQLKTPAAPPSPRWECEVRGTGLSGSIHAPPLPSTCSPLNTPSPPWSPTFNYAKIGASANASIHAPQSTSSLKPSAPPLSPIFECEKKGAGVSASIHAPRAVLDAPQQTQQSSVTLKVSPASLPRRNVRNSWASASRWDPKKAQKSQPPRACPARSSQWASTSTPSTSRSNPPSSAKLSAPQRAPPSHTRVTAPSSSSSLQASRWAPVSIAAVAPVIGPSSRKHGGGKGRRGSRRGPHQAELVSQSLGLPSTLHILSV